MTQPIILAVTGASGAVYAVRLLNVLLRTGRHVHLTISPSGRAVLGHELQLDVDLENFKLAQFLPATHERSGSERTLLRAALPPDDDQLPPAADGPGTVSYFHHNDMMAPMASGSFRTAGMVVCPCSGATLSAVARAASTNLIQRAADVHLKERRKLILVPRETPLSSVQLDNMKTVSEAGAVVLPAAPGWYHDVQSIRDLVDFVVARILDQLAIEHRLISRWGESE